jgi:hypothetical protein
MKIAASQLIGTVLFRKSYIHPIIYHLRSFPPLPLGGLLPPPISKKPKTRAAIITAAIISPILLLDTSPFPPACFYFYSSFLCLVTSIDEAMLLTVCGALRCALPVLYWEDCIDVLVFSEFLLYDGDITVGTGTSTFYSFNSFFKFRGGSGGISAFDECLLVVIMGIGYSN